MIFKKLFSKTVFENNYQIKLKQNKHFVMGDN